MKKQLLSIFTLALGALAFGQIGLNTATPAATLDITAKNTTGASVEGLFIPRVDRLKAQSMTSIPTSTLIYVNSIANGTLAGNAVNIDAVGYYFYNGSAWAKLDSGINLYNSDGTLNGNRIVTQGNNTLAFTGNLANAFSVDGTTFSVNAANNRVGIGTITPTAPLEVNVPTVATGVQVIQPTKSSMTPGIRIAGTGAAPAVGQVSTIGFNPNMANGISPIAIGASYLDAADSEADADFIVATSQGGNGIIKFTVKNNGRVGVLTTTPQKTMHVNGSLQVTNELNIGGNATTAGSAGTTGQILTSNGAGNAPSWENLNLTNSTNIYNADGTLTGNRLVTQGTNTLRFNPTVNNGFSVKGSVLSVDGLNNRVGMGTTTPSAPLEVTTATAGEIAVQVTQPLTTTPLPGLRISGASGTPAVGQLAMIGFNPNSSQGAFPILAGASYLTSSAGQGSADFVVATSQGGIADVKFTVKNAGDVGIGTITPQKKLHVNGSLQVTNELNVGGNATTAGSAGTAGQVLVSNGTGNAPSWQAAPSGTEVDGIIGNEVVNGTAGGALTRSGTGTTASPYTLDVADQGITTAKIADNNVTYAKINTPVTNVTGSYTLLESDKGGFVYVTSATAANINVPDTLSAGFHCVIIQQGAGQVTVTGNNLTTARGLKTRTQYSAIGVIKRGPGITTVTGDGIN